MREAANRVFELNCPLIVKYSVGIYLFSNKKICARVFRVPWQAVSPIGCWHNKTCNTSDVTKLLEYVDLMLEIHA